MKINNVLNKLFSSPASVSVLRELSKRNKGVTGRELSRLSGLTPQAAHNTLNNLESLGIVKRDFAGRSHIFTLNRQHYLFKNVVENIFIAEENFRSDLFGKIVSSLKKVTEGIVLYGSVARRDETTESDLDICIITENKNEVENIISGLRNELKESFGVSFAPYIISRTDFEKKYEKNKSPVKEIVAEGKVLYGKILKGIKNG